MFNGLSIAHDFSGHKLGFAMSTCAHDPDGSDLDNNDDNDLDTLDGGPDTYDSRPQVVQNRYFSDGTYHLLEAGFVASLCLCLEFINETMSHVQGE